MQHTNKDSLGKVIKQQRILLDLSQAELSRRAGVSHSLIFRLEKGDRSPSARTLRKLAKVLGISEAELLMYADYLSKPASLRTIEEDTRIMKLDPQVVFELSKEPLKIQRALLAILKMLRSLAADIASENTKDSS